MGKSAELGGGEMKKISDHIVTKFTINMIIMVLIILSFFNGNVLADDPLTNIVSIVPEDETISSDIFSINVTCTPSENVKSYELELSFDPTVFTITSVSEGDFFTGYDTFFSDGTIDNSAGTVTDIYGLIVGPGTIDSTGVLISLTCSVVSEGSCMMQITSVGLTNESSYLSVNTINETITIDQSGPEITTAQYTTSNPLDTDPLYGWINLSCNATDDQGISQVTVSVTCPNASILQRSCTQGSGNTWYWNSSSGNSMFTQAGNYSIRLTVLDASGNQNTSSTLYVDLAENWDVNNDNVCDLLDFIAVSNYYDETNNRNGWIREDVDNNGEITVLDLVILSNNYESTW